MTTQPPSTGQKVIEILETAFGLVVVLAFAYFAIKNPSPFKPDRLL